MSRVRDRILPLSHEDHDVKKALQEWRYCGNSYDYERPEETCQLCGQEQLRYHFEIENVHNGNTLQIGSRCITRYEGIEVISEAGHALSAAEAAKKVTKDRNQLIKEAKIRNALGYLVLLSRKDPSFIKILESCSRKLKADGYITPLQLLTIRWRLEKHQILHNPQDFIINLRRNNYKADLLALEDWKQKKLMPYLSPSQRKWLKERM